MLPRMVFTDCRISFIKRITYMHAWRNSLHRVQLFLVAWYYAELRVGRQSGFFKKYRDSILFNRNLIIAGAGGFFASALVSQLYSQHGSGEFENSVAALATEYAVYVPAFALLFYFDNRHKYVVDPETGKKDRKRIMQDVKKLFASFSVSEVIFSVTRIASQYAFLQLAAYQPYEASMASSLVAWGVFFVSINLMARATRLFKRT